MTRSRKDKNQIINLYREIDTLKKLLHLKVEKHGSLCHPEVVFLSKQLDEAIVKAMKIKNSRPKGTMGP